MVGYAGQRNSSQPRVFRDAEPSCTNSHCLAHCPGGMSDLIECPHCLTTVLPKADRTCPACRETVDDRPPGNERRTSIQVRHGAELPPVCWHCGTPASRYVTLAASRHGTDGAPRTSASCVMMLLSLPIGLLLLLRGIEQRSFLRIRMPACDDCAGRFRPEATYVDFENARATVVVNRKLREAIEARQQNESVKS